MIRLQADLCQDFGLAIGREWLVTNGLGGYASGTVAGANSRRYHGLLVAALAPPVQRKVLLATLEEWLLLEGGELIALSTQEYWDGTIFPRGFELLSSVELDSGLPVFSWAAAGRTIEKRIWMEAGADRTVIRYQLLTGAPARLRLQPLFAHRDFHDQRHGQEPVEVVETADGWQVTAGGLGSYVCIGPTPSLRSRLDWYWRFLHRAERERGLDAEEDLFTAGQAEVTLTPGDPVYLAAGTEAPPSDWSAEQSWTAAKQVQADLLLNAHSAPDHQLAVSLTVAAAQFRVARAAGATAHRTVIAGYHWFGDWGRDTMVSLPGLTLASGQPAEARAILRTFLSSLDQGMLPNFFKDEGQTAEYNTMDATLWLFQAVHAYQQATDDWTFLRAALPRLQELIRWHVAGTRYQIRMDPADGLLGGGEEGVALTWMDARVDGWVVTPRRGKPIEVNALWYNALRLMADWSGRLGQPSAEYAQMARRTATAAQQRFWYEAGSYLYDVVDGPEGDDPSLRPNQVMALSLPYPLIIDRERAGQVLTVVTDRLLTPFGLRTLDPADPRYRATYAGDQRSRDGAYHMGTVWPWLLGPYCDAHLRLHGDHRAVRAMLQPFVQHLSEAGLGSISEIFEPEPPFRPVGCIAQAWSVAEILRHAIPGPDG